MSDPEDQNKGFKVTDRRSFTPEGELRSPEGPEEVPSGDDRKREEPLVGERSAHDSSAWKKEGRPEVRFLDLLSLLATQASLHMGEPNPVTGQEQEDLQIAQMMISMIEVLKEKTEGNLSSEETRALDEILYQLRMRFMVKAKIVK